MTPASHTADAPWCRRRAQQLRERWQGLSDHNQVGVCLAGVTGSVVLWALVWPVPTEVKGAGLRGRGRCACSNSQAL